MKSVLIFSLFLALICSSCLRTYPVYQAPSIGDRFSPIPTFAHEKEVELFAQGTYPADSNYIKILPLEVQGANFYEEVAQKIKLAGASAGVDAILLEKKQVITNEESPFPQIRLSGTGIKYHRNLAYLNKYLKVKHVYQRVDTGWQKVAMVHWGLLGHKEMVTSVIDGGEKLVQQYVKENDIWHLMVEQNEQWKYSYAQVRSPKYDNIKVYNRNYYIGKQCQKKCKFYFPSPTAQRPYKAIISTRPLENLSAPFSSKTLRMTWQPDGKMTEMLIYPTKADPIRYLPTYKLGKYLGGVFQWYRDSGDHISFLKVDYEYYTVADFADQPSLNIQHLPKTNF